MFKPLSLLWPIVSHEAPSENCREQSWLSTSTTGTPGPETGFARGRRVCLVLVVPGSEAGMAGALWPQRQTRLPLAKPVSGPGVPVVLVLVLSQDCSLSRDDDLLVVSDVLKINALLVIMPEHGSYT